MLATIKAVLADTDRFIAEHKNASYNNDERAAETFGEVLQAELRGIINQVGLEGEGELHYLKHHRKIIELKPPLNRYTLPEFDYDIYIEQYDRFAEGAAFLLSQVGISRISDIISINAPPTRTSVMEQAGKILLSLATPLTAAEERKAPFDRHSNDFNAAIRLGLSGAPYTDAFERHERVQSVYAAAYMEKLLQNETELKNQERLANIQTMHASRLRRLVAGEYVSRKPKP